VRIADDVAWVDDERAAYVAKVPYGDPLVLEGSAAAVWRAIADGCADVDAIAARAAALTGADLTETVASDVRTFVQRLVAGGLVV